MGYIRLMIRYNWQEPGWPRFQWKKEELFSSLALYTQEVGKLHFQLLELPSDLRQEALIEIMVQEAKTSAQIEGEMLAAEDVRSSVRSILGLSPEKPIDPRAQGMGALMVDIRKEWSTPLTKETLFYWHRLLFEGREEPWVGKCRTHQDTMQIVSCSIGSEKVHFEAPPSRSVPREMSAFITWFNEESLAFPGPVRAAITHLYFESIHPFEDGNGRIGRAICEKAISQDLKMPLSFSLSDALMKNRKSYYEALHRNSRGLEITDWILFFLERLVEAQSHTKEEISFSFKKFTFWKRLEGHLNPRQIHVLQRMLREGRKGFQGGISAGKYLKIVDCSKATATRDLQELVQKRVLLPLEKGGRSTRYEVNLLYSAH